MRVHYVQHVPYEGIGAVNQWVRARGHVLSGTQMFRASAESTLPDAEDLDFLVVMGGPMNIYEENEYPWHAAEKALIASAVDVGKTVLGICLGAQLIADVLNGPVTQGTYREIGWFPVDLTAAVRSLPLLAGFPARFTPLHWHGDTFAIPPGAVHLASSAACDNQAFALDGGRVVGLQFHLEETRESLMELVSHAGGDLRADDDVDYREHTESWVACRNALLAPDVPFDACRQLLFTLLDSMTEGIRP